MVSGKTKGRRIDFAGKFLENNSSPRKVFSKIDFQFSHDAEKILSKFDKKHKKLSLFFKYTTRQRK